LYNHELKDDFNKIVSLVKKTKPKAEDLEESDRLVQYHCFDSYYPSEPQLSYKERKERVASLIVTLPYYFEGCVEVVGAYYKLTDEVTFVEVYNEDEVEEMILNFISDGYEGIMLKKDVPYFFGRSFDMLKYKKFFDKEFKIVDFEEGNGNLVGIAAAVICETEDGQTFKAGVMGTQDYARNLFTNKDLYKGKMATIVYQALTPMKDGKGGVPRFGKMREIRNYE
jgi:ATP-dependent DNA ligase